MVQPMLYIQEVGQFHPKGRTLSMSMGSELLAGLYDCCPMGAQMGGELLISGVAVQWGGDCVYLFQERRHQGGYIPCVWLCGRRGRGYM